MRVLYWFRRDLRIRDNKALIEAASKADKVAAVFVIDPEVLRDRKMNFDDPRFIFLLDALRNLGSKMRLHVLYDKTREAFEHLLGRYRFDAIYTASPLSWHEDALVQEVKDVCRRSGVRLIEIIDNLLADPSSLGSPINFTMFYRKWRRLVNTETAGEVPPDNFVEIDEPDLNELCKRNGWRIPEERIWRADWYSHRLQSFSYKKYAATKDYPYLDGTSKLSPYISLGIVSVREVFNRAVRFSEEFVRQLAWREFYYHLKRRYPYMRDLELNPRRRGIMWENDKYLISAFKEGKTGYPIVDAGIKQLKAEKWIHNRVRLIVANFLVKDLLVDWRIGEEFFKEHLIDYDEVLNVGNWQWSASVGVDPLPIRIFNPVRQAEKYDPLCLYVKRYIPELTDHECERIHDPIRHRIRGYYEPIVDHNEQIKKFREMVSQVKESSTHH
ncbi:MAG: deoxyribodipyrimidine photo-lyase [Nitrososphaerota archaeon]